MFPNCVRPLLTLVSAALLAVLIAPATDRSGFARMVDDGVSFERGGHHFLTDLVALSDTEVYGVGFNGLVRFDGRAWKLVRAYPRDLHLQHVAASGGKLMALDRYCQYVVIDRGAVELGEPIESPFSNCRAGDITTDTSGKFWMSGEVDGRGLIARWSGETWIPQTVPETGRITAIDFDGDSHAWAFAKGVILEWVDGSWSVVADAPAVTDPINAVQSDGPSNVWAVGGVHRIFGPEGFATYVALHFDGSRWSVILQEKDPYSGIGPFNDVVLTPDGRVLVAAGKFNVHEIRDGAFENLYTLNRRETYISAQYFAAARLPGGDVWFVGGLGSKVRLDGEGFYALGGLRPTRFETRGALSRVAVGVDARQWAVGAWGPPLWYDGEYWQDDTTAPDQEKFVAVGARGRDVWFGSGWALRGGTEIWRWNGAASEWILQATETDLAFVDIVSGPSGDMFAVASNWIKNSPDMQTDLLRLDGDTWRLVGSTTLADAFTATVDPTGTVWLAGTSMLRWEAGRFDLVRDSVLDSVRYWDVASNSSGTIAVAGVRQVYVLQDGEWSAMGLSPDGEQDGFQAITVGPDGSIWVSSIKGLFVWRDGEWGQVPLHVADPTDNLTLMDLVIVVKEDSYEVLGVGEVETIVRIDPSRLVTHPVALPTGVATRPVDTPTPRATPESRTKIHLPFAVRRVAPGS